MLDTEILRSQTNEPTREAPHLLAERAQLLRIDPVPYALHVVPVCHDAVFHGILDLQ